MLSETELKNFIEDYSFLYKSSNTEKARNGEKYDDLRHRICGIGKFDAVSDEVEDVVEKIMESEGVPTVTWKHIAWKAGRLKYSQAGDYNGRNTDFVSEDGRYFWDGRNGMGNFIINFKNYLKKIQEDNSELKIELIKRYDSKEEDMLVLKAYDWLEKLNEECDVRQFGPVYIIALIYFMSKGRYPIYDRFSHIALKALCMDSNPNDIYYGSTPDKGNEENVMKMYNEYCWLLVKVFGKYSIGRKEDQALWVYGHSKIKYPPLKAKETYKQFGW